MVILVVDDSRTIRFMMIKMLRELGYDQIDEAGDVDSALLQIQVRAPDLIFSDFNMPGKNGLDFLKAVRLHPLVSNVPFVMVTTMHDKRLIVEAVKAGLQFYLLKPVEKSQLIEKIEALSRSHGVQAPRTVIPVVAAASTPAAPAPASSSAKGLDNELVESIIEHFFLVFDGEMTIPDCLAWCQERVMPALPSGSTIRNPQDLLAAMRVSATAGLNGMLRSL